MDRPRHPEVALLLYSDTYCICTGGAPEVSAIPLVKSAYILYNEVGLSAGSVEYLSWVSFTNSSDQGD
jgi:hypothetical protein